MNCESMHGEISHQKIPYQLASINNFKLLQYKLQNFFKKNFKVLEKWLYIFMTLYC
jgi:hypothetical protein